MRTPLDDTSAFLFLIIKFNLKKSCKRLLLFAFNDSSNTIEWFIFCKKKKPAPQQICSTDINCIGKNKTKQKN